MMVLGISQRVLYHEIIGVMSKLDLITVSKADAVKWYIREHLKPGIKL